MASVHLARMDGPGGFQKWVAIKRIHPNLVEDDQFVDMFLDEARIAAGINHANVAQVFDLGKDEGTYWIAMEYLHGEPLREVMRRCEDRRHAISPDIAARLCADAADGLHAAHELRGKNGQLLGLVHRDVTPHNLFITYEGYTKVVDFGIAKVADRLSETRAGTLKGKLAYMSPEQVRGQDDVDRTTDVFALGVVLWELTTGHRLFRMDTDLDTLEKVQACVVPPPSTVAAGYPIELESVVMKALAKKKADRFQTAREFSRALNMYLQRRGVLVGPEEVSEFVRELFADRIGAREAHLAWAADVTSTINVEQLQTMKRSRSARPSASDGGPGLSRGYDEPPKHTGGADIGRPSVPGQAGVGLRPATTNGAKQTPPPPPTVPQGASQVQPQSLPPVRPSAPKAASSSLMDDEEDIPTTVATREHVSELMANVPPPGRSSGEKRGFPPPPPAAGMPARPPLPNGQSGPSAAQLQSIRATSMGGVPALQQPSVPPAQNSAPPANGGTPLTGLQRTVAIGPQSNPGYLAFQAQQQASQPPQGGHATTQMPPITGQPPSNGRFGGDVPGFMPPPGMAQMTSNPSAHPNNTSSPSMPGFSPNVPGPFQPNFGFPGQQQAQPSQQGQVGQQGQLAQGGPTMPPHSQQQMMRAPPPPPSQIETALSLPRPEPSAFQTQIPQNRSDNLSTIVLISVAVLTAICVLALGALIYFKYRSPPATGAVEIPVLVESTSSRTG